MARKLTDKQKAEAAKKAEAGEIRTGGADEGAAAGAGDGRVDEGATPEGDPKPAAKPKAKANKATPKMVSVKTARGVKSRWRVGLAFGPEPVEIPLADLSEDQLEALDADPKLVVQLGK